MKHLVQLLPLALNHNVLSLEVKIPESSLWEGFTYMAGLGIQYIKADKGHLLFLLILLLPATLVVNRDGKNWGGFGGVGYSLVRIVKILIAFAVGHSVTLIIGATGVIHFPARLVEVLIAISTLVAGIHACKPIFAGKEMFIAAGFGLIHGMAFAEALVELHPGFGRLGLSILGFNVGIELMLAFIIATTIPWLIILSKINLYKGLRVGGVLVASIVSAGWLIERITGTPNPIGSMLMVAAGYMPWLVFALAAISIIGLFMKIASSNASSFSE